MSRENVELYFEAKDRLAAEDHEGFALLLHPEVTATVVGLPEPGPFVELHPVVAQRLEVGDGTLVRVRTRRGTITARARLSAHIRPDTVFMAFHWVGANLLTNDALDPSSRMPEFKVCAAQVGAA